MNDRTGSDVRPLLQPLRPSYFREVRAYNLKPGDVIFAKGRPEPIEVLERPRIIQRGFGYIVGQWGFPVNRLAIKIRTDGRLATLRVVDHVLFNRPKRRLLPRL